jgi:hypothetical protein
VATADLAQQNLSRIGDGPFGANVIIKEITLFGADRVSCDWRK